VSPAPLRIGIAGAGSWARDAYAPIIGRNPDARVSAVWSRTPGRAAEIGPEVPDLDALIDVSDAVVVAVVPDAQPEVAVRCLEAGRPTLLEKPLALDTQGAERIAEAAARTGTPTQMMLTYRYAGSVRDFLARLARGGRVPTWGRAQFVSGVMLRPEAGGWRAEARGGAVHDLGPHLLDLVMAALGTVVGVEARGDHRGFVALTEHESGAACVSAIHAHAPVDPSRTEIVVGGPGWIETCDARRDPPLDAVATAVDEFVETARSRRPHALDAAHGLALQRVLAAVDGALAAGR
jgi:predicted dehydrogenase